MSKITDIYKQKAVISELNKDIVKYGSDINALKNKKKSCQRWAIIPPVIVTSLIILSSLAFKASTGFADWATLSTIFETSSPFLGISLLVSSAFPVFYGISWHNTNKEIIKKEDRKKYLEECLDINKEILHSLQNTEDLNPTRDNETNPRLDIIKEFCVNEKDMLLELYAQGKLGECSRLGFSVYEILYIKSLLESMTKNESENVAISTIKEKSRQRVNPKIK